MTKWLSVCLAIFALACNKGGDAKSESSDKPGESKAGEKANGEETADDTPDEPDDGDDGDDTPDEPDDGDDGESAAAAPAALGLDLPKEIEEVEFLGWTKTGDRFAVEVAYMEDNPDEVGWRVVRFRQVHETLTGALVGLYRVANSDAPQTNSLLRKAHKKAGDKLDTSPFEKATASRTAGEWKLIAKPVKRKIPDLDTFTVEDSGGGWKTKWSIQIEDGNAEPYHQLLEEDKKYLAVAPRLETFAVRGKDKFKSLTFNVPFKKREFAFELGPSGQWQVNGSLKAYWSPDGKRLVWVAGQESRADNEALTMVFGRFYVRAAGPQVKVVDAGVGDAKARAVVAALEEAGVVVTVLETAAKPSDVTKIYFRGKVGKATADRAAGAVGGSPEIEEIKKGGWIDVIVYLGGQ